MTVFSGSVAEVQFIRWKAATSFVEAKFERARPWLLAFRFCVNVTRLELSSKFHIDDYSASQLLCYIGASALLTRNIIVCIQSIQYLFS